MAPKQIAKSADWWIFFSVMTLLGIGLIMVFSSTQYIAQYAPYNDSFYFLKKQGLGALIGLGGMFLFYKLPYQVIRKFAVPVMVALIGALVLVVASEMGSGGGGALRFLEVGGIRFQPSEFCKPVLIVVAAIILSKSKERVQSFKHGFLPVFLWMVITCGLVIIEDLSTGVVMAVTIFLMMFCAGIKWRYLFSLVIAGVAGIAAAIIFEPYRVQRIFAFLDPAADSGDTGYQIIQSLYAIGSGGLSGVGLGASTAKWYYLPARHTDFIFSIYAEEVGFLGCVALLLLFALFIWRGLNVAVRGTNTFVSIAALGITAVIGIQAVINLLVVVGFAPVTGITLPFISYGVNSLIISLSMVGLLLNLSRFTERSR